MNLGLGILFVLNNLLIIYRKEFRDNLKLQQAYITTVPQSHLTILKLDLQTIQGPSIYYVIKILVFLDPTHPSCNQALMIK